MQKMVTFSIHRISRLIFSYLGTVLIIAAVTILLKVVESTLEIQIIALIYLLPILVCTVFWA